MIRDFISLALPFLLVLNLQVILRRELRVFPGLSWASAWYCAGV